jgi:hypothetical protein
VLQLVGRGYHRLSANASQPDVVLNNYLKRYNSTWG